jgi:hypothetical protein
VNALTAEFAAHGSNDWLFAAKQRKAPLDPDMHGLLGPDVTAT